MNNGKRNLVGSRLAGLAQQLAAGAVENRQSFAGAQPKNVDRMVRFASGECDYVGPAAFSRDIVSVHLNGDGVGLGLMVRFETVAGLCPRNCG